MLGDIWLFRCREPGLSAREALAIKIAEEVVS
jgi:hypothetical protein